MSDKSITNTATGTGQIGGVAINVTSNTVTGTLSDGLTYTKAWESAQNKGVPFAVTLTVKNTTTKPLTSFVFVDVLASDYTYVTGTAKIDGVVVLPASVTFVGNVLSIATTSNIAAGASSVCTFQLIAN